MNAVDAPASLRGHRCWGVVEIVVVGFQKTVINLVKLVAEDLLGHVHTVGRGVGSEQDAILIAIEEPTGSSGLPSEFADASAKFHVQVSVPVELLRYECKILRVASDVQSDELSLRMARDNA